MSLTTGPEEVLSQLATTPDGLASDDAAARLATSGPNELSAAPPEPFWKKALRHFDDVLIYILLASAALKAAMGDWVDFAVIIAVALINAVIGLVQEGRAEKALEGIKNMLRAGAARRQLGIHPRPRTGTR